MIQYKVTNIDRQSEVPPKILSARLNSTFKVAASASE